MSRECTFTHVHMVMAGGHVHAHMPYLRPSHGRVQGRQAPTLVPSERHQCRALAAVAACVHWAAVRGAGPCGRSPEGDWPALPFHKPEVVQASRCFMLEI